jgi:prephenate dehydrogenase
MAKPVISIIGLGTVGASLGLGLQREPGNFELVGHDRSPETAQSARKAGSVQRVEWNLFRATEGAELIILAVPLNELDETLKLLGEEMKPGTLVFALNPLLQPAIKLGERHLPAGVHFVAGHPILSGVGSENSVRADLLEKAVFALAAGLKTDPGAVQLASDFVERVGATPLFVDALEHDGIIAGVEQLPQLMGAALMRNAVASPGWREARRLAGSAFAATTDVGDNAAAIYEALRANRENLLVRIRQMQQELGQWATLLEAELPVEEEGKAAKDPLLTALELVVQERITWEGQSLRKEWDETPAAAQGTTEASGFFRQMFLGNFMGKRNEPGKRNDGPRNGSGQERR